MSSSATTGSIAEQIRSAAARNSELLSILHDTDHAPAALEQQNKFLDDLRVELKKVNDDLRRLELARKKELREHEDYRDSVMKRFAYRVSGKKEKFAARAEKEEKEYFDVLQKLQQKNDQKNNIESMLEQATQAKADLEAKSKAHKQAQTDLDSLYQGIFQGTTPEFPEEDSLERATDAASQAYHQATVSAKNTEQVFNMLNDAWTALRQAAGHIEEALSHSRMDMFGGGTMSDMMERNALSMAQNSIHKAEMLTTQAQKIEPTVPDLPTVGINHGNIMSDVFFDNIFTDMAFHEKIKDSRTQLQKCVAVCERTIDAARGRSEAAQKEMAGKWEALLQARNKLQTAREQIFERVMGGSGGAGGLSGTSAPAPAGATPSGDAQGRQWASNNPYADQPPAYSS